MTYRSFCQPNELMDLLVERFKIPDPDGVENKKDPISMKAMKTFKTTYVTPIQLRYMRQMELGLLSLVVCVFLLKWFAQQLSSPAV